jgi:hypothetical protein
VLLGVKTLPVTLNGLPNQGGFFFCGYVSEEAKPSGFVPVAITNLGLEVKTSFGNSMPVTGSSTESSSQKPVVPTDNRHQYH